MMTGRDGRPRGPLTSLAALVISMAVLSLTAGADAAAQEESPVAIAVHGGAGTILPERMTDEREREYREALAAALEAGNEILRDGGSSLDAVVAAIRLMEDSPLFNAGVGAVFTSEGTVEHDASIMDGGTRNSGAVAGVKHVKNPIVLARRVMDESEHVMMAGEGAEAFGEAFDDVEFVPNDHFYTERRREAWERARERSDADPAGLELGTVGAVALDRDGNLAAATSTGGTSMKRFGRIGDSPIIGAGTYADNATVAVSSTGHGEYFIRGVVAHDIAARVRYAGLSVEEASAAVVHGKLVEMGGTGGVIALDGEGRIFTPFNTAGMYRGWIDTGGEKEVRIFR